MSAVGVTLSVAGTVAGVGALGAGIYYGTGRFGEDQAKAAEDAAAAQGAREEQGLRRYEEAGQAAQEGMQPYQQAGTNALQMQQALSGALGPQAQAQAYAALQQSPMFASMLQQGETSLLQNASATGGLRGGNTQQALATMGPQLLQALAQQQFGQLGSLSGMGLSAAGQAGQFGLAGAGAEAGALSNLGAIEAGGIIGPVQARLQGRQQALGYGLQAAGTAGTLLTGMPTGGVPAPTGQGGGY
jgi:hypothetical protein